MGNTPKPDSGEKQSKEFTLFAAKRIIVGAVGIVLLLWLVSFALSYFESSGSGKTSHTPQAVDSSTHPDTDQAVIETHEASEATAHGTDTHEGSTDVADHTTPTASHASSDETAIKDPMPSETAAHGTDTHTAAQENTDHQGATAKPTPSGDHAAETATAGQEASGDHAAKVGHAAETATEDASHAPAGHAAFSATGVTGVAFVEATIAPMHYELEERYYGWRPNDIVDVTDNVNNYQLGVLEVTRRTVEALLERISSTGGSQTFDKDLELARNNLMIKASDYMLPSAEASYEEALEALQKYRGKLLNGTAFFYGRIDNLIPLLRAYENLLGSSDDKLIRHYEDDGSEVSWFRADDYFYYAKGVASAMHSILEAVAVDFATAIETRRGTEILHHTLESLHHATQIDPILILDSAPDGFLANHRANMAAHISHARFFVGLLIETLST